MSRAFALVRRWMSVSEVVEDGEDAAVVGVLAALERGMSNREIAAALVVEESRIRIHVKRIPVKLHLRDRFRP